MFASDTNKVIGPTDGGGQGQINLSGGSTAYTLGSAVTGCGSTSFAFTGTGSLKVPNGTTAQRDSTPETGMLRWNTDNGSSEIYDGSAWSTLGGVDSNSTVTATQFITPNTTGSLAARNKIDNGAMEVNQRGGSQITIDSSTSKHLIDRWVSRGEGNDSFFIEQDASAPYGFRQSLKFNCANTSTGAASSIYTITQNIEGYNVADFGLGGGSSRAIALSFWVKASITGDWGGSLQNSAQNRSYPFVYNIAVADDWEYKTILIPGPTSGSWNNTDGIGLRLNFDMGCGSSFRGNAGSWNNADDRGPSGAISPMQTLNSVWRVTGVQLEMGPACTPFEYRGYPVELQRCKRYYQTVGYT